MGWRDILDHLFDMCRPRQTSLDLDDDNADAVISRNLWKNHRLLPPVSAFRNHWDLIMIIFVFYNCLYIPMELVFSVYREECLNTSTGEMETCGKHLVHRIVDYVIDALFFVDIFLNFRTTYYDGDYEMVLDWRQISRKYVKTWFMLDFVAVFPFELFTLGTSSDSGAASSVTGLLKLPRLLRLGRLLKKLDQVAAANAFRIVHLLVGFLLIAHWVACLWWFVGKVEFDEADAGAGGAEGEGGEEGALVDVYDGKSWLHRVPGERLTLDTPLSHQ